MSRPLVSARLVLLGTSIALAFSARDACAQTSATSASARPRPYPASETPAYLRAIARGTRTRDGQPGPNYWQQRATYTIDATLDPVAQRVTGRETIHYVNASPDTLRRIAVYLRQNLFAPGVPRDVFAPITGGIELRRVVADGTVLGGAAGAAATSTGFNFGGPAACRDANAPAYEVTGTVMWITLPKPLLPRGGTADLTFDWAYTPPPAPGDGRQGADGELFLQGYWYPQVAVYDDVDGWATDPYLGQAEFYMGYADYDVRVTVPDGWLVAATGRLANADAVLAPDVRGRLREARRADTVVHVVRATELGAAATQHGADGRLVWHFTADNVRDFVWAASARHLWDATRAFVGPRRDTVDIYSFFRDTPQAAAWTNGARYGRIAIEYLSDYLWPYPWPQMTSVEGILDGGGMEYPMLTAIQSYRDTVRLRGNLMHEIGHMWFPMHVGSSETRHAWMDEGLTQFNSAQGQDARYGEHRQNEYRDDWLGLVRKDLDAPLVTHSDKFDPDVYFTVPYEKTATVLVALRSIVGDSVFHAAYREYGRRWRYRHPMPHDFFHTFEAVSGRDLDWFWRTWWYETWTLDQAIASVKTTARGTDIVVEDRGLAPMPARLLVTRANGRTERMEVPVERWLAGARRAMVHAARGAAVVRVELDPDHAFPDIDRSNDLWTSPARP
jgi:hypothetical protein